MKESVLRGLKAMSVPLTGPVYRQSFIPLRELATRAFSRAAGAPLVGGNKLTLLRDATDNYPAWLQAIASARHTIHFESYIIHEDEAGRQFAQALAEKASQGVRVRLIYDWLGSLGRASRRFWRHLADAGVEVRCFNPPRLDSPLGWLRRDHRKSLTVDGRIGFVTGLCVGQRWVGDPAKGIAPWRDTGVSVEGPAVADLEEAFAYMWALLGPPISDGELSTETLPPAGDVALRIVASYPNMAGLYRFDQLTAALAERFIWITDAYFLGTAPYIKAMGAAAMDGVDVRLLLPSASDVPIVGSLSRAGYRELLEAGVRVYEWNGPMMHAKTAVADGRWARVGSTNMNLASWLGNWELDVVAEDDAFAQNMEHMYLEDLENSTEIVLSERRVMPRERRVRRGREGQKAGSARGAVTSVMRMGNTMGAAITSRRALGPFETVVLAIAALLLLVLAAVAILWPMAVAGPLAFFSAWVAVGLLIRTNRLRRARKAASSLQE
jgi:cardiolipin synthase